MRARQGRRGRDDADARDLRRQLEGHRVGDMRERDRVRGQLRVPVVSGVARHREHRRAGRDQPVARRMSAGSGDSPPRRMAAGRDGSCGTEWIRTGM